jgi:2-succinyl-6-hydroxy-2,4-cyclohexadiene-1-carboxylate synthase
MMAEGLFTLIEALELDRVGLVGYSMGGRIALYSALRQPHQISTLILESCSPGISAGSARRQRALIDDGRAESILADGLETFVDHWYDMELFHTLRRHLHLFQVTKEKRKMNDREWAAKVIAELSPGRQPSLWTELDGLRLSTLLLAGALDSNYVEVMTAMSQKIPKSRIEIVPEAGHNIHLEHPSRFIKLVVDFMGGSPLFLSNS